MKRTFLNRRDFLRSAAALAGGWGIADWATGAAGKSSAAGKSGVAGKGGAAKRPDVLFIVIEDFQACPACYGNRIVKTPNMDALAARGVRFDNAHCQFPLCNPTRSSFLTGLRPKTTGVFGNEVDWNEHVKPGTTMPEYFRSQGYETVRVSKIFHAGNQNRVYSDSERWNKILSEKPDAVKGSGKKTQRVEPTYLYENLGPEERQKKYDWRAWVWGPTPGDDIDTADGRSAEQAVRLLSPPRKEGDKPLFFAIGFHKPHLALNAPRKYFDMYPPEKIPLPDCPENELDDVPHSYSMDNHKTFTPRKRQEAIAAYYACVSFVDAQVGRVLEALKTSGRDKHTIVVLLGDHGFHLGEHLLWQKMTLFEESSRVPLIFAGPEGIKPGAVCAHPVELVDLFPTLADLCGLPIPEGLESVSMSPLLKDPTRPWKKGAFTELRDGVSVRTDRWRYTEWGGPDKAELYDHQADPRERNNLAKDSQYAETKAELHALLQGGWKAAHEQMMTKTRESAGV